MQMPRTRVLFRVLSGLIGLFVLCVGLPVALLDGQLNVLERVFFSASCFVSGIGLIFGAFTGRWFSSPA